MGELWQAQGQLWEALAELQEALGELWEDIYIYIYTKTPDQPPQGTLNLHPQTCLIIVILLSFGIAHMRARAAAQQLMCRRGARSRSRAVPPWRRAPTPPWRRSPTPPTPPWRRSPTPRSRRGAPPAAPRTNLNPTFFGWECPNYDPTLGCFYSKPDRWIRCRTCGSTYLKCHAVTYRLYCSRCGAMPWLQPPEPWLE